MSLKIDIRRLQLINEMAKQGGNAVAEDLTTLTGLDAEMEVTRINFLNVTDIKAAVGDRQRIGISVGLVEPPHGHILFLIDAPSAKRLAQHMIGTAASDDAGGGFSDLEKSAIEEFGNIMTSGFIDGWANALDTTIDISTPQFAYGAGSDMIDDLLDFSSDQLALVFDSKVHASEADVGLTVYLFPDLEELVELMRQIEV